MTQSLRYAYNVPSELELYPLLGSAVRALGKKQWNIAVFGSEHQRKIFQTLRDKLKTSVLLQVPGDLDSSQSIDLVLSFSPIRVLTHSMVIDRLPVLEQYDLISAFTLDQLRRKGVVALTGTGKGKTTTAIGIATESFLKGGRVAVIQWFKEKKSGDLTWAINEHAFPNQLKLPDQFQFFPTGAGFVGSPNMDRVAEETEHRAKAESGFHLAKKLILSGEYSTIVLDEFLDTLPEVMNSLPYRLLDLAQVQELLHLAQDTSSQIVVTGRQVIPELAQLIKTSITITEVKHPWSSRGAGAVSGLDF